MLLVNLTLDPLGERLMYNNIYLIYYLKLFEVLWRQLVYFC